MSFPLQIMCFNGGRRSRNNGGIQKFGGGGGVKNGERKLLQTKLIPKCLQNTSFSVKARSSDWKCSIKKVFLKTSQNSQENTCARVSLKGVFLCILVLRCFSQVFSCVFCEIVKHTFFTEQLQMTNLKSKSHENSSTVNTALIP